MSLPACLPVRHISQLNELNFSLQKKMTTAVQLADKVTAFNFKAKLELWERRVYKGYRTCFQHLKDIWMTTRLSKL